MIALQYLACLFWILACITGEQALVELARLLDCLAHFTYVTCVHTCVLRVIPQRA